MKRLLQVLAVAVACSASAQGNFEAINNYSSPNPIVATSTGTVGWSFQPTTDINLTALGCFNYIVSAQGTTFVGLWSDTGSLLASNAITQASSLVNQSRYEFVTPVSLFAS